LKSVGYGELSFQVALREAKLALGDGRGWISEEEAKMLFEILGLQGEMGALRSPEENDFASGSELLEKPADEKSVRGEKENYQDKKTSERELSIW
jgi:hypothetical protein